MKTSFRTIPGSARRLLVGRGEGLRQCSRKAALGGAVVAFALPLGLAAPAEASTSWNGCTAARAQWPTVVAYDNKKWLRNKVNVWCNPYRSIQVQVQRMESDDGKLGDGGWVDDVVGLPYTHGWRYFGAYGGSTWVTHDWTPIGRYDVWPNNRWNEFYHLVRFRVYKNGVISGWSAWEKSPTSSIWS